MRRLLTTILFLGAGVTPACLGDAVDGDGATGGAAGEGSGGESATGGASTMGGANPTGGSSTTGGAPTTGGTGGSTGGSSVDGGTAGMGGETGACEPHDWDVPASERFIARFEADDLLVLPATGDYDFEVDWGDGTVERAAHCAGSPVHRYETPGIYRVEVGGDLGTWAFQEPCDAEEFADCIGDYWEVRAALEQLREIVQWGAFIVGRNTFAADALYDVCDITVSAEDAPVVQADASGMFEGCEVRGDISHWDMSQVTNLGSMFWAGSANELDVSGWDTSSVTSMRGMFSGSDFNGDISTWDTSSVIDTGYLFEGSDFNGDISTWDTSSVIDMEWMFRYSAFNGDISAWDTSNVVDMQAMFQASAFSGDVSAWDTSNVTDMSYMFGALAANGETYASAFDGDVSSWDVSSVQAAQYAFSHLSTENYDALLIGWSTQDVQPGVSFGAGTSQYSAAAVDARALLAQSWTITDGGPVP